MEKIEGNRWWGMGRSIQNHLTSKGAPHRGKVSSQAWAPNDAQRYLNFDKCGLGLPGQ